MNAAHHPLRVKQAGLPGTPFLENMVGNSPPMRALAEVIRRAAPTSLPILLRGETGSGKELAAAAIHRLSTRAMRPFVALNAATVTSELSASQLFGHVSGAFTGASSTRNGAFREAHGGTLFIDELGCLPLDSQAKLLRVLEEKVVIPVGTDRPVPVDVRLVAATCEALEKQVFEGTFRRDLYQRLSVIVIEVPPLRERREDIPELAMALLAASELRGPHLCDSALLELERGDYDGNVRELRNVVLRAALSCEAGQIKDTDIRHAMGSRPKPRLPSGAPPCTRGEAAEFLRVSEGNVSLAARRARLARSTYRDLLTRHSPCEPPRLDT